MSKALLGTIAGVVVVAAAAAVFLAAPWDGETPPPVSIGTLDAWVEFSTRPGFALLDKRADDDYFIAVYRTAADEVAFCYRWRRDGEAPATSFGVRDPQGHDVQDASRRDEATELNETGPLPAGGFVDGMVMPIRRDYVGPVVLEFRDDQHAPGTIPSREVYSTTLPWQP